MWLIYLFTLASSGHLSPQTATPFVRGKEAAPLGQAHKAPPNFRVIEGNPLQIHVGEDLSFQVFHADIPGSGQIFPAGSNQTADMGVMVWLGNNLYTPNFDEHPSGSAAIFNAPHWEQISMSSVSGAGTRNNPFMVEVRVTAADVAMTMTVTYVNGETFFRTTLDFTAAISRELDIFFAGDIFLADNDSGIPLVFNNGVGGFDCFNQGFSIVFFPITPADALAGNGFAQIWQNVANGALDNGLATSCLDNGAGLEWRNRVVGPGNPLQIAMATSFGLDISTVPTVNMVATDTQAGETGPNRGAFTFSRDLTQGDLQVFYSLSGTATNGVDFETISGSVVLADGQAAVSLPIVPIPDSLQEGDEQLTLTLRSDAGYTIGENRSDTITIADGVGTSCGPPTQMSIGEVTTNSLLVTVNLDQLGGRCRLFEGDTLLGAFETAQGGLQGINTEGLGLLPSTTYTVCCTNFCADGSESEQICVSVTTLSDVIPPLKSPQYIRNTNFYPTEAGELGCFFPDPNVDGSDHDGSGNLVYVVTLEDPLTCEIFLGPVVVESEIWPVVVKIAAADITSPQYNIGVRRSRRTPGKRDEDSDKVLIAGPDLTVVPEPDTTLEFDRWLLHMPRKVGGFDGKIEIRNPNSVDEAQVLLVGYDFNGLVVDKEIETLAAQETKVFDLYGNGASALFSDPALLDRISHVALWDRSNLTKASLQYISQKSGYDTWVDEVNLNQQAVTGQEMEVLGSTPDNTYFTGVAVLNLAGTRATEVVVVQRDPQTRERIAEVSLGMLGPGQKLLSVVSSVFANFVPNAVFTIETRPDQGTATIQVLGLAGLNNGDFLNSARVVFKK